MSNAKKARAGHIMKTMRVFVLILRFHQAMPQAQRKPQLGDLIVLFQTISDSATEYNGTYLTHLVEVTSNEVVDTGRIDYPKGRPVRVLARVWPEHSLPSKSIGLDFGAVNTGQLCRLSVFNKSLTVEEN